MVLHTPYHHFVYILSSISFICSKFKNLCFPIQLQLDSFYFSSSFLIQYNKLHMFIMHISILLFTPLSCLFFFLSFNISSICGLYKLKPTHRPESHVGLSLWFIGSIYYAKLFWVLLLVLCFSKTFVGFVTNQSTNCF